MEVLGRLFLIDPVPGWSPVGRPLRRAAAAGKHHLADPGIAAFLLGVEEERLLREPSPDGPSAGRPLLAALFESLVALSVRVYARTAEARVGHLRTRAGEHEVDLIVHRGSRVIAIEVKMARVVTDGDARHLRWLAHELGDDLVDSLIVTAGPEAYRLPDGVGVVPAALLGP